MKRVSFALVLVALLLSFGLANAFEFEVIANTYSEGGNDYIGVDGNAVFEIYVTNTDRNLTGWSTAIGFTQTGTFTLGGAPTAVVDPTFKAIWNMLNTEMTESWDGDLSVSDRHNFTGVTNPMAAEPFDDWDPGQYPRMLAFTYTLPIVTDGSGPAVVQGTLCIDSSNFTNDIYDWLFDPPLSWGLGTLCYNVKKMDNDPGHMTNVPTMDIAQDFDQTFTYDFNATDLENNTPYTWQIDMGTIDANGVWTFNASCPDDLGSHTVTVGFYDTQHVGEWVEETFTITVGNTAPTIAGECGGFAVLGTGGATKVVTFTGNGHNAGDVLTFSGAVLEPAFDGTVTNVGGVFTITTGAEEGVFTLEATVTDCGGLTASCQYSFEVLGILPFDIAIEKVHNQLQGHHSYVEVTKEIGTEFLHGFDFLIGYDASALTFIGADGGVLFDPVGMYQWEYFTYRYSWNGNCGGGCPTGLLRVVAIADQNNGGHHPLITLLPDDMVLFTLDFLVSNDRTFECMFAPVYFYWMDCGDNTVAFQTKADEAAGILNIQTGASDLIYHWNGDMAADPAGYYEYHNNAVGFPTAYGAQGIYDELDPMNNTGCFIPEFDQYGEPKPGVIPFINFFNGGVDIVCADDIDARGDVNLNGVANEIADAVVFTNYFIYGLNAFTVNVEGQIAATEINGDGIALSVADLVYLIRVIVGDALPLPKVAPAGTINVAAGNVVSVDAEVGAAAFTFAGNANVTLADGAAGMELITNFDGVNTYALIYSLNAGVTASGALVNTDANLVKFDAADYNGGTYSLKMIPDEYSLKQNYPNPFNPTTVIEAAMKVAGNYALTIYNVAGQKVADFSGFSEAGIVTVNWDASQHASGIYFYNFKAGSFEDTKKMVLLK
ncbi:MAG: T9SS type A sorting domain-containing protein [Candidatus Zixiibacteriota bacterium]